MEKFNKTSVFKDLEQLNSDLLELLTNKNCTKTNVSAIMAELLEKYTPKAGGGQIQNPSYVENGVTMHYCRYLTIYRPEDEMVMSSGKSKGYSKIAISRWTKAGKDAKVLQSEALKCLLTREDNEELQNQLISRGHELNEQAEELLLNRNKPSFYQDLVESIEDESVIID